MIGDRYHPERWNCTHEVSQWYSIHGYTDIPDPVAPNEWDLRFVRWMRKRFTPVEKPSTGCLVLMTNKFSGGKHVGVWDNGMVHHCFQPPFGVGQTIRSPMSLIRAQHINITFWSP